MALLVSSLEFRGQKNNSSNKGTENLLNSLSAVFCFHVCNLQWEADKYKYTKRTSGSLAWLILGALVDCAVFLLLIGPVATFGLSVGSLCLPLLFLFGFIFWSKRDGNVHHDAVLFEKAKGAGPNGSGLQSVASRNTQTQRVRVSVGIDGRLEMFVIGGQSCCNLINTSRL